MNGSTEETIYALATASGRAGISIFRVSGPAAFGGLQRLTGLLGIEPRKAVRVTVSNGKGAIDDGLVLAFPGPASFTGEDVVEYQMHGGRAVQAAMMRALADQPGYRIAEPGEFSWRAVLNGKMDLTAAEGIADLVDAETEAQRFQAQRQSRGELGILYQDWRRRMLRCLDILRRWSIFQMRICLKTFGMEFVGRCMILMHQFLLIWLMADAGSASVMAFVWPLLVPRMSVSLPLLIGSPKGI